MSLLWFRLVLLVTFLFGSGSFPARAGAVLEAVKSRGHVVCGLSTPQPGFAMMDGEGQWSGFDVDFCRAVAAAVVGDGRRAVFVPLNAQVRFDSLIKGEIDVLFGMTTWTLSRDAGMPLDFTVVTFFDGQGFMARRSRGWQRLADVEQATVCVAAGTTTLANLEEHESDRRLKPLVFDSSEEAEGAFFADRCDLYSTDASALAALRMTEALEPEAFMIFPDRLSKEPLGPVVRGEDRAWFDIVKWVVFAIIEAEELGITSSHVDDPARSRRVRRFLGVEPGIGAALGLDDRWAYRVIRQYGNYGEIFDRTLGLATPLKQTRGINTLWTRGGLLYAMPFQ
ncbi:MAG: aapJ [Rhodospirillaceae bacterium]|nr:MAG: aapJ [Rhodospirillaceae bacterium]